MKNGLELETIIAPNLLDDFVLGPIHDLFKDKKIVIFGLPGAFTPTCSSTHLPGYEEKYDTFKKLGIDEVVCMSVNDDFVMQAWGESLGIKNVKLLADGNLELTNYFGMRVSKENLGMGNRCWRFSAYVDNGTPKMMFVEEGMVDDCPQDPFEKSDADSMIAYLEKVLAKPKPKAKRKKTTKKKKTNVETPKD